MASQNNRTINIYVDEIETKRSLQAVNYVHYEKRKPGI